MDKRVEGRHGNIKVKTRREKAVAAQSSHKGLRLPPFVPLMHVLNHHARQCGGRSPLRRIDCRLKHALTRPSSSEAADANELTQYGGGGHVIDSDFEKIREELKQAPGLGVFRLRGFNFHQQWIGERL